MRFSAPTPPAQRWIRPRTTVRSTIAWAGSRPNSWRTARAFWFGWRASTEGVRCGAMGRNQPWWASACIVFLVLGSCGSEAPPSLDRFLPPVPKGQGGTSAAGRVTEDNAKAELLGGTAAQGRIGDWYLRNDQVRFILQHEGD